ncbi:MAG: hypothetical protein J6B56_00185 [Clostridia bacterium]|nr:hypothetical protein [Clostridia bacterium]
MESNLYVIKPKRVYLMEIAYTASRDYIRLAAITYQTFNLGCLWWR